MTKTNRVLKCVLYPKCNITNEEAKALKELRQDKDRVILTVDKRAATVLLYKAGLHIKPQQLTPPTNTKTNPSTCSGLFQLKED